MTPVESALTCVRLGVRGALLLPLPPSARRASWDCLAVLTLLVLGIRFLADFSRVGAGGEFALDGLPAALFFLPLLLLAAWCCARLAGRSSETLLLATAFAAIAIFVNLAYEIIIAGIEHVGLPFEFQQNAAAYAYLVAIGWYALAIAIAAIRLLSLPPVRWTPVLALSLSLIAMPLTYVQRDPTLWRMASEQDAEERQLRDLQILTREDVFYHQPALLRRQLDALLPGKKNVIDLYFVGVAGYAGEDVFMKEVDTVTQLFDQRFATAGRSIMLINNAQTIADVPIASVTALDRTLSHIGKIMNRNEDILFLFLTSHGTDDHRFTLEFGEMQFAVLDPATLKDMLDASGIRHRVLVVSACYSGGFVEALKDDYSLIITAAAPDRTSFGCNNENEFTYFGRAYFDEALRETDSFITAFERALPVIAAREKQEDFELSSPQIHIGEKIREQLALLSRQRAAATASTKKSPALQ